MSVTVLPETITETVTESYEHALTFAAVVRVIDAEFDLSRDRTQLRRAGLAALSFATEADLELLNYIAGIYTTHRPSAASRGLHRIAARDTPRSRHLALLLAPPQPGFAPEDPRRYTNPHLYRTVARTDDEHDLTEIPDTAVDDTAVDDAASDEAAEAGSPWNPHAVLPRIRGAQQRREVNRVLEQIVDCLSQRPYGQACEQIARLRMLCAPENLVFFDACVPATDPGLYQPTDPDLHSRDTIARGLDAAQWHIEPVRDRYRPQRPPTTRPSAVTATPRKDSHAEQCRRLAAHRAKGAARRRAAHTDAAIAEYFDTRGFLDHEAEQEPYDYVDLRERAYLREAEQELAKRSADADRERRRKARRRRVVDAADARRRWDRVYVDFVSGQLHSSGTYLGDPVACEDYGHRVAEDRTQIRIAADERDPFQRNGNDLDYDQAAVAAPAGWPCVSCFIERPDTMNRAAHHRIGGGWRSDDGLCQSCRMDGRAGIPALAQGFTTRALLEARCAFLVHTYAASADHVLDRVARALPWRHPARAIIRTFLSPDFAKPVPATVDLDAAAPTPTPTPTPRRRSAAGPAVGRGQRRGRCRCCFEDKAVHDDDRCTGCRLYLGIITAPAPKHTAAA